MKWIFLSLLCCSFASAQEGESKMSLPQAPASSVDEIQLEPLEINAERERLNQVAPSQRVGKTILQEQKITDPHRALKQVPGVQVQEEDGQGLRPNIGIRGTHPHRSRKIVMMEDGILIGPAPYSAPAAYYAPSMLHTEDLEVFKGLSAVPYGPNSIGGAVNYRTPEVPQRSGGRVEMSGGSYQTGLVRADAAGVGPTTAGLISASNIRSKGFKKLPDGQDTGYVKNDVLLKGRWNLSGEGSQSLGMKLGYADEDSHETYVGLADFDFNDDPYRRYRASELDEMKWQHTRAQIDYQRTAGLGIFKSSLYRHDFHRNWKRLDGFQGPQVSISQVLKNPSRYPSHYGILTGTEDSTALGAQGDGNLLLLQNDRRFYSQGWQNELWQELQTGSVTHSLTLTARLHEDQIQRNHLSDSYSMTGGQLNRVTPISSRPALNRDRATVRSLSLQDEMTAGDWKPMVVARFEDISYTSEDDLTGIRRQKSTQGFAPGVGVARRMNPNWTLSASVNRGLVLVNANAGENDAPEDSLQYELGSRYFSEEREIHAEFNGFFTDYRNLKGICSFSSGCKNDALETEYSGGRAHVYGLEGRVVKSFRRGAWAWPVRFNATALKAHFNQDIKSQNGEWGNGLIRKGDPLPYVPSLQASLGMGAEYGKWKQELVLQYTSRVYDQSVQEGRSELPAYGVVDWNGRYQYSKLGTLFAKVDNLLAKKYAVSWRPYGLRPGKPQSFMVGVEQFFD